MAVAAAAAVVVVAEEDADAEDEDDETEAEAEAASCFSRAAATGKQKHMARMRYEARNKTQWVTDWIWHAKQVGIVTDTIPFAASCKSCESARGRPLTFAPLLAVAAADAAGVRSGSASIVATTEADADA